MKKIFIVTIAILALMCGSQKAMAQKSKFGHVDYAELVQKAPEYAAAEAELKLFADSLQKEGEALKAEFEKKYNEFQQKASTYSEAVKNLKQKEVEEMYTRLQAYAEIAQEKLADRQSTLIEPIQKKVLEAVKEVAKANGYNYVFDVSTQLYNSESDDLTNKVKEKLGVK